MSRGVQIGLKDVHYALLTTDDVETGVTYEEPAPIIGAITANINPNASMETLFADDGPMETAASLGQIELELNVADLPLSVQAALLGHEAPTVGEIMRKAGDVPPWLALGFRSLKSNGKYRYVWLLKGKFMVPEQSHETKGDTITFQTPTINGSFVKRDFDDAYQLLGDEDETDFAATDWFKATKIAATPTVP
jgi:phi13 family phage major tail protein